MQADLPLNKPQLRSAFDRIVAQTLPTGAAGLSILYFFFAGAHWLLLAEPGRSIMTQIALSSAVALAAAGLAFRRHPVTPCAAHPWAAILSGIVLLNCLLHIYVTRDLNQTQNILLLIIGVGCIVLSGFWLSVIILGTLAGWTLVGWALVGSEILARIEFGLISATVLAIIAFLARVRVYSHLEQLRARDAQLRAELELRVQQRTNELTLANAALQEQITERMRAEQALRHSQKMDAIGQLAAGVAHDFNNLLTVIQGHASLLANRCASRPDLLNLLSEIQQASDRAASLTRQLLAFSRKQFIQRRKLNLNDLTRRMNDMLSRLLGEQITLVLENSPALPAIEADAAMLDQVIMNIAVNASDAMPRGGKLTIRTSQAIVPSQLPHPEAHPGTYACLSIEDTGAGIPPQILSRIFEPFFTTKPLGKGTGLGLSTVYGIVQQHSGWIDVKSELNVGTRFDIYFPALPTSDDRPVEPLALQPQPPAPVPPPKRNSIFVIEDERAVRELACLYLQQMGYHIFQADSAIQGRSVWQNHHHEIDLLLTDLVLPGGVTGLEFADECRGQKPSLKIIYTSGYSTEFSEVGEALRPGDRFLAKPYHLPHLVKIIQECLSVNR